ncbi:MAG: ImmA/IrrE family metallo-endopeptidase, partial [Planctomycetales bacterium]|nr:ImmA/IrrE family metallo-endopeptidase [Planctomycetales bacterium]
RAFAAELLAPVDGLIEFLVDDRSDEALDEAAEHFQVSARTVAHQLENNAPA